jgi:hypothetical protein
MARLVALLLFLAQWGLVGLAAVHHHGPGNRHEDECSICQVLHSPVRLVPPATVALNTLRLEADLGVPLVWEAQRPFVAASCRGPPATPGSIV